MSTIQSSGSHRSRRVTRLAAAVIIALLAGEALAQRGGIRMGEPPFRPTPAAVSSTPVSDQWLRERIAELDSGDLAVRDAASAQLTESPHLTLDRLIAELAGRPRIKDAKVANARLTPPLTPEAFRRLEAAAAKRFLSLDRAALGTGFSWDRQDLGLNQREMRDAFSGVSIQSVTPGWDSARVLKPGDLVLQMSGMPVSDMNDARSVILSHDPGDRMEILIRRDGRVLRVSVQLGRYSDLNSAMQRSAGIDQRAWRVRVQRVTGGVLQHRAQRVAMTPLDERAMAAAERASTPPQDPRSSSDSINVRRGGNWVEGHEAQIMPMPSELMRQLEESRGYRAEWELVVGGQPRGVTQLAAAQERELLSRSPADRARLERARNDQLDELARVDQELERVGVAMERPGVDADAPMATQLIQQHRTLLQRRAVIESRLDAVSNALAQTIDDAPPGVLDR